MSDTQDPDPILWESLCQDGYVMPLAYRKSSLHDDSIFKLFLMTIMNIVAGNKTRFTLQLQRLLAGCSSMTGEETRVMDSHNLEPYDYPRAATIPTRIPKRKNGRVIRFLFVYHRFVDDSQDECSMYALGFQYLRKPVLEKVSVDDDPNATTTRLEVKYLRPMQEWDRWIDFLLWLQDFEQRFQSEPTCEQEREVLLKIGLLTAEEPPTLATNSGYVHVSCKSPVMGCIGLEEIARRIDARLHFYERPSELALRPFEEHKYGVAFPCTTERAMAVDLAAKYALCAILHDCPDVFLSNEVGIFQMRLKRDLADADSRELCLRANNLCEDYATHVAQCEHEKSDCFHIYLACEHFRGLREILKYVHGKYFEPLLTDEIEEVSLDEGGGSGSTRRGQLPAEDAIAVAAMSAKSWMLEKTYI